MANPRKFSEKIALQKQKQAEGTAEFEKIMREVSDATSKVHFLHYPFLCEHGELSAGRRGGELVWRLGRGSGPLCSSRAENTFLFTLPVAKSGNKAALGRVNSVRSSGPRVNSNFSWSPIGQFSGGARRCKQEPGLRDAATGGQSVGLGAFHGMPSARAASCRPTSASRSPAFVLISFESSAHETSPIASLWFRPPSKQSTALCLLCQHDSWDRLPGIVLRASLLKARGAPFALSAVIIPVEGRRLRGDSKLRSLWQSLNMGPRGGANVFSLSRLSGWCWCIAMESGNARKQSTLEACLQAALTGWVARVNAAWDGRPRYQRDTSRNPLERSVSCQFRLWDSLW